ncbi:MAG: hypothetical protein CMP65_01265 [Flavobacteriales bacterium]|nr:hypothetical protein [Flavobacteriales bacterium]
MVELIGYILFVFAGLFFGLFGSGGSIIIIPVLIYVFNIPIYEATTYSLLLVCLVSLYGTIFHLNQNTFQISRIIYFAIPSVICTAFSRALLFPSIPDYIVFLNLSKHSFLMVLFSVVIFLSGFSLLKRNSINLKSNLNFLLILLGVLVGILSGLLGIGGGFIIVPTLMIFANMDIKKAASCALFVITLNTLLALILEVTIFQFKFDVQFIFFVLLSGLIGLRAGVFLLNRINLMLVKKMFSITLLCLSFVILIIELL